MSGIILNPPLEDLRKFGPLAHVTEAERKRIMSMPSGQVQRAISNLEKEIAAAKKKGSK